MAEQIGIYQRLAVRLVINAWGTLTPLGGSLMRPEVVEAMADAARAFVDLPELLARAGEEIAAMSGVEAAHVTAGAAAGLTIATAACVAGTDPAQIARLPDTSGMRNEVIVQKPQRCEWDQAVRLAGVRLVEIGLGMGVQDWELDDAITDRTAAVLHFVDHNEARSLPLHRVLDIADQANLPVIVDAAAALPPADNLHTFTDMGADLVVFSGGKMIRGPQSSGLILGRRDLIAACAANASPNAAIGRPMKVGKEEIAGLVRAVELFLREDWDAEQARSEACVDYLVEQCGELPGVEPRYVRPGLDDVLPRHLPRMHLRCEHGPSAHELQGALLVGEPHVAAGTFDDELVVNPVALQEGEEVIVARRIGEILRSSW